MLKGERMREHHTQAPSPHPLMSPLTVEVPELWKGARNGMQFLSATFSREKWEKI